MRSQRVLIKIIKNKYSVEGGGKRCLTGWCRLPSVAGNHDNPKSDIYPLQWFDLVPKGTYSLLVQSAYQGQGAYFFFKEWLNIQKKMFMFIQNVSEKMENRLVVQRSLLAGTTSQTTDAKFWDKIIRMKDLCSHVDIIAERPWWRPLFL